MALCKTQSNENDLFFFLNSVSKSRFEKFISTIVGSTSKKDLVSLIERPMNYTYYLYAVYTTYQ